MSIKLLHGAHVPHRKNTADCTPKRMPVAAGTLLTIPVSMNIGAPAKPCVKKGDHVDIGQVIGEAQGFMSVPVHASVSGEVIVYRFCGIGCEDL